MLHLTPSLRTASPLAIPVPQEEPSHSPPADFRVNVQQGASDQVAGCGAEDGRRVEDGCKGGRASGGCHACSRQLTVRDTQTPGPPGEQPTHTRTACLPSAGCTPLNQSLHCV